MDVLVKELDKLLRFSKDIVRICGSDSTWAASSKALHDIKALVKRRTVSFLPVMSDQDFLNAVNALNALEAFLDSKDQASVTNAELNEF